jgi:hypothetical protein
MIWQIRHLRQIWLNNSNRVNSDMKGVLTSRATGLAPSFRNHKA